MRIALCDVPELSDSRPEIHEKALEATQLTEQLAPPGSFVWLRDIRRDKYFRLLARVEANGVDITDALLEKGLAKPYTGGSKANNW